jgi:protease I
MSHLWLQSISPVIRPKTPDRPDAGNLLFVKILGGIQVSLILTDKNIAIVAADGFDEHQMTEIQRALTKVKARVKIVAPEAGLINGWQGEGWGHHFHVDAPLGETLGSDFDMLVLPDGERSTGKLKQNLHVRRVLNHFLEANKPIAAIGAGVGLLALGDKITGRAVAAPAEAQDELKAAGISIGDGDREVDGNLLTATGDDLSAWVEDTLAFFADADIVKRAA